MNWLIAGQALVRWHDQHTCATWTRFRERVIISQPEVWLCCWLECILVALRFFPWRSHWFGGWYLNIHFSLFSRITRACPCNLPRGQRYLANDVREKKIYIHIYSWSLFILCFFPQDVINLVLFYFILFFLVVLLIFFIGFVLLWWKIFTRGCRLSSSSWQLRHRGNAENLKDEDESPKERLGFKSSKKKYLRFEGGIVKHLMSVVWCVNYNKTFA